MTTNANGEDAKDLIEVDLSNLVPFTKHNEKSQKDGQTWWTTLTLYRDRDLWPLLPNLQHARGLQAPWKT